MEKGISQQKDSHKGDKVTEAPPTSFTEWVIRYLWKFRYSKWIIALIALIFIVSFVWPLIPASSKERLLSNFATIEDISIDYSPADFEILERRTIIDLRSWRKIPEKLKDKVRYSPVFYTQKHLLEKKKKNTNYFIKHHWTSGYTLDVGCHTHPCETKMVQGNYKPGEITYKKFQVEFNVLEQPEHQPFNLDYQAIYWNAFQNEKSESIGATIVHPTRKLVLEVFLPVDISKENFTFKETRKSDNNNHTVIENPDVLLNGNHLIWTINNPKFDYFYTINWKWDINTIYSGYQ